MGLFGHKDTVLRYQGIPRRRRTMREAGTSLAGLYVFSANVSSGGSYLWREKANILHEANLPQALTD